MTAITQAAMSDELARDQVSAIKRMAMVDALPPDIRECVYDFGLPIVRAFLDHGVVRAKSIRHLVSTMSAEMSGAAPVNFSNKGATDRRAATWLEGGGYLVVPKEPSPEMIDASISALDDAGIAHTAVERRRKHAVRLSRANALGHARITGKTP